MKTELDKTKAAMISYKNMQNVVAEQVKTLKLVHERKKDEHDHLMNALREMQAENTNKEKLGKLYFIIMLSRWQEAAINQKYDSTMVDWKNQQTRLKVQE
jgi:hypothetical protein